MWVQCRGQGAVLGHSEREKDMKGLRGKRIVFAGGTGGIGAASVERLVEEGASVVIGAETSMPDRRWPSG